MLLSHDKFKELFPDDPQLLDIMTTQPRNFEELVTGIFLLNYGV